jgi:hypothetical protein
MFATVGAQSCSESERGMATRGEEEAQRAQQSLITSGDRLDDRASWLAQNFSESFLP